MKRLINVSRGQAIAFAANDAPISGIIVSSKQTPGPWATIIVETTTSVSEGAQLSMPDLPETGGCGMAQPISINGRLLIKLSIGYSYIDTATIGK
jgi:hypothetical protein